MVLQSDRIGSRPGFSVLSMILSEDRLPRSGQSPRARRSGSCTVPPACGGTMGDRMPLSFAPSASGILPDRLIAALAEAGGIPAAQQFAADQIQPASLDLRLGAVAYRVRASFLPGPGSTVARRIAELKLHEFALTDGAVLETGCVYIVPLIESLNLPAGDRCGHQSEELDRAARRFYPRHRRRDTRLRSDRRRLSRSALCGDQSQDISGAGARRLRGCRKSVFVTATRCSTAKLCARCTRASAWSIAPKP